MCVAAGSLSPHAEDGDLQDHQWLVPYVPTFPNSMIMISDPSAADNKSEKSRSSLLQQVTFLSRACYPNNKTNMFPDTEYENAKSLCPLRLLLESSNKRVPVRSC
ncbi:hypothetical protein N7G274_009251 [Stereocaulon virgatum]|uniref:Uncharacterized protein n=1 Tax=Stereocaulon virgatum TaxID=373712 RepID=A0ABR3ZZA3_9LECA